MRMRAPGQTVVVMALMMVVLVGLLGLSIDVGNVYGQQRRVQSAVDASSLAGMLIVEDNASNATVLNSIRAGLQGHGLNPDASDGSFTWSAYYLVPDPMNPATNIALNIATQTVGSANPPSDVKYVAVTATEIVNTTFARVINQLTLPAHGVGFSGYAAKRNVMPLTVPLNLTGGDDVQYDPTTWNYGTQSGIEIPYTGATTWTPNSIFQIPQTNRAAGGPGSHVGWWKFNASGSNSNNDLRANLAPGGTFHVSANCGSDPTCYQEASPLVGEGVPPPPPYSSQSQSNGHPEPYDWVAGIPGVRTSSLMDLAGYTDHGSHDQPIILPLYIFAGGHGQSRSFQLGQFGRFLILDVVGGNGGHITLQYLGPANILTPVTVNPGNTGGIR
ncbi:MAG: hypothetical protein NVS2B7_40330 [Herpetosiphon sp.]